MTKYITCNLMGGLGNQLFEIFTTIKLARATNMEPIFHNVTRVGNRETYFKTFLSGTLQLYDKDVYNFVGVNQGIFSYVSMENRVKIGRNVMIVGYFQSYKYLDPPNIIKKYLYLSDREKNLINNEMGMLRREYKTLVSLHVRRTDYLKAQHVHNVLPISYYKNCIKYLKDNDVNNVIYLIFSDDIEWCKNNFDFIPSVYIKVEKDYLEMVMMSCCDHNIIANSSFSWWGAYLNENIGKKVLYPSKWFNGGNLDVKDMCPDSWIKIDL